MKSVRSWLESLGLGEYFDAFEENAIEWQQLPKLDHEVLKDIGIKAAGHRMALLEAAARLTDEQAEGWSEVDKSPEASESALVERRQLSVMFCDLVGSVEYGERLDVEDYRDLLSQFRKRVVDAVQKFGGFVARHQGDGVLVYFGYPRAREDDAERAVRAGLAVVRSVEALEHPSGEEPRVRVGIATGPAIVGDVLSTGASKQAELAALGSTPNLAARLQGQAEPNGLTISETTRQLVAGLFDIEPMPARELRGLADPVIPWQVRSELVGQSRFAARSSAHLSPFVGREEELELLIRRWSRAKDGHGQIALLVGEPGIGKSRLLRQLRDIVKSEPHEFVSIQCSPNYETSALQPVIEYFERVLNLAEVSEGPGQIERVRSHLSEVQVDDQKVLDACLHLLSIPTEGSSLTENAARRREKMFAGLVEYFCRRIGSTPVLFALEDVHWSDPSTRELLGQMVQAVEGRHTLLMVTSRPGFDAEWRDLPNVQVFSLSRLDGTEGKRLAQAVAPADIELTRSVLDDILSRAGGNPLFIEELTRAAGEVKSDRPYDRTIPATLRDSLTARLDASEPGKAVAQCASVIGRTFEAETIRGVWDGAPAALEAGLDALTDMRMLTCQGSPPHQEYAFRHALICDSAYETLLRQRRLHLHRRVAATLEGQRPELAAKQPELLARHYWEGGEAERAAGLWLAAAHLSLGRSAEFETIAHIRAAQAALDLIPLSDERDRLELELLLTLGPALMSTAGSASAEVKENYSRALDLSERVDAVEQKYNATWGLWLHYLTGGQLEMARQRADEIVTIGRQLPDSTYLLQGHHAMWTTESHAGNDVVALHHAEQGIALYSMEQHKQSMFFYGGHDAGVCGLIQIGLGKWLQGYPDRAVVTANQALELAEALEHPPSSAVALLYAGIVYQLLRRPDKVQEMMEQLISTSVEHGMPAWVLNGEILRGWALGVQGDPEGLERMKTYISQRETTASRLRQSYYLILLADLYLRMDQADQALDVVARADATLDETGETRWQPLATAVHGDLLRQLGDEAGAERYYRLGLDIARRRGARSFELSGAMRLAGMLADKGEIAQARALLVPIYDWYTEGFDTPDLEDAKALLRQIG